MANFCDYFVICSGSSTRQVKAIADAVEEGLNKLGVKLISCTGKPVGSWVLLDYLDIVVHIFYQTTRAFYDIEHLWQDAPRLKLSPFTLAKNAKKHRRYS